MPWSMITRPGAVSVHYRLWTDAGLHAPAGARAACTDAAEQVRRVLVVHHHDHPALVPRRRYPGRPSL